MSRRPIAFNNSTKTANSVKKNKVEVGVASDNYASSPGGLTWFNGADSTSQYVIYSDTFSLGMTTLANAKPVCWASGDLTDVNVLRMINGLPTRHTQAPFTTIASALAWVAASPTFNMVSGTLDNIVTDGLIFNVDCSQKSSYPGSGTTWYDLSGNGNDGTLINGPTFSSANGGSIVLDGVNDIVNFGNVNLSTTNKVSVSFWCKILAYTETPGSGKVIFEVTTNFNSSQTGFLISYADDSNPSFLGQYPLLLALNGNSGYTIPAFNKNLVNDLQWHHYVCIFDKSQTLANDECKLYLDGSLRTPIFYPGGLMSNNTNNFGNDPLFIGGRTGPVAPSNVQIPNLLIYNRVLTQAEVTQNFNAQKSKFGL